MKQWFSIAAAMVLMVTLTANTWAKRAGPKEVAPVVAGGVKYVAPNENGRQGKVEARDAKTGEKLWEAVVYTVTIDRNLEEDVQWVFISGFEVADGTLRVTNEKKEVYSIDLKTKEVKKLGAR